MFNPPAPVHACLHFRGIGAVRNRSRLGGLDGSSAGGAAQGKPKSCAQSMRASSSGEDRLERRVRRFSLVHRLIPSFVLV